ncbi:MAG: lipase family protein [Geminicoccaceae bacterium]
MIDLARFATGMFVRVQEENYADNADAFAQFAPSQSYVQGTARALMWMAQLAYEGTDDAKMRRVLALWGFDPASLVTKVAATVGIAGIASTSYFIARRPDSVVLAFQGTDPANLANWLTDFWAVPTDAGLHGGFAHALDAAAPGVLAAVQELAPTGLPLMLTGHSLGGALAVLAAEHLTRNGVTPAGIYTFGMPRVGGIEYARTYDDMLGNRTFRLVHGEDLVPRMPPSWLHGNDFCHVGRRLTCPENGRFDPHRLLAEPDNEPDLPAPLALQLDEIRPLELLKTLWPRREPGSFENTLVSRLVSALPGPIRDHLPDKYLAALAA